MSAYRLTPRQLAEVLDRQSRGVPFDRAVRDTLAAAPMPIDPTLAPLVPVRRTPTSAHSPPLSPPTLAEVCVTSLGFGLVFVLLALWYVL